MIWLMLSEIIRQKGFRGELKQPNSLLKDPTGHGVERGVRDGGGRQGEREEALGCPPGERCWRLRPGGAVGTGRRSQALKAEPAGFPDGFPTERESQRGTEDEAKDEWDCRQPKGRKLKEARERSGDSELTLGHTDMPAQHPGQDAQ